MEGQITVQIENLMISANTNTVMSAIAYNKSSNLLAYASANAVLILDPSNSQGVPQVLFTLKGHTDRINGVQWLSNNSLVSISADKTFIVWVHDESADPRKPESWSFKRVYTNLHSEAINYFKAYNFDGKEFYLLTMCSAGTMILHQGITPQTLEYKDKLLFGKNLQESVNMVEMGEKHLLVVVGGYDVNIHCYLVPRIPFQEGQKTFKYKFSLLGHFNSLRDFDFTPIMEKGIRYMASSSQDGNIRLWKLQPLENLSANYGGHANDLTQYESKTSFVLQDELESKVYNFTLESVLLGHQDSVSSIRWGITTQDSAQSLQDFCLLSSSFDFNVCVWKPDRETGVWTVESRLGAMQGNKHAYFGAFFMKDDQEIMSYTYNGAMHKWKKNEEGVWQPQLTVKGHFGEVTDLDWDQYQASLFTCSQDQTTRLFSKFGSEKGWFEIGRPQVHGYDMNTLACLKSHSQIEGVNLPSKLISGGDEKVIRMFDAPFSYVKVFNSLHPEAKEINLRFNEQRTNEEMEILLGQDAAKKQPLGLMNKPTIVLANQNLRVDEEEGGGFGGEYDPTKFLSNTKTDTLANNQITEPPVEDVLMLKTLWPETQKLYGHAFEVFCITASHDGTCAASACKAKDKKYAEIVIWDLRKAGSSAVVPVSKVAAHGLTVVQMEFSKDDLKLLSCSRDRQWCLFSRNSTDSFEFTLLKKVKDAHTRIIWGINWSHDDTLFATASREKSKSVKVWNAIADVGSLHSELPNDENPSATAVQFFPSKINKSSQYALLVGLESGDINIWALQDKVWMKLLSLPQYYSHCATVRRIKFNQRQSDQNDDSYVVASAGNDHTVRILKIQFN